MLCVVLALFLRRSPSVEHTGPEDTAARRQLHFNDHTEATVGALGVDADADKALDGANKAAIGADQKAAVTASSTSSFGFSSTGSSTGSGSGAVGQFHELDARHPNNVELVLKGQSHHEAHHASMLQDLMHGRLDELLDAATKTFHHHQGGTHAKGRDGAKGNKGSLQGKQKEAAMTGGKVTRGTAAAAAGAQKLAAAAAAGRKATVTTATAAKANTSKAAGAATAASTSVGGVQADTQDTRASSAGSASIAKSGDAASSGSGGAGKVAELPALTKGTAPAGGCKGPGKDCGLPGHTIHTLFTSNGSPYQNFQARIMVATWHLVRKRPEGKHLVALTRILHRTTPDEIMDEVDTFRAQPLQPQCDKWCWFPVADRANAVQQWINATVKNPALQKAPWLLLLETDYVWIKPLPAPGDAYDPKVPGLSFFFDYIGTSHNHYVEVMLKDECPTCDPASVPNSGPAPVLARFEDFKAATPLWEKLSLWIETHEDAKHALGWVREMYAWDIGVAANRLNILNQGPSNTSLIAQPPHDSLVRNASMYHYTWGSIFKKDGKEVWQFDKRTYTDPMIVLKVPRIPLPPPWEPGVVLHNGQAITKELHAILSDMITHMNEGIDTLPDLSGKAVVA